MMRFSRLFLSGGQNAVPLTGWWLGGWSPGTALVYFWFENLILSLAIAARISAHWRATRTRGHTKGFLKTFLVTSLGFTIGHGVFLAVALTLPADAVNRADLESGVLWLGGTQVASLAFDVWGIGGWPFAEIRKRVDWVMGRVVAVHLSILVGMFLLLLYGQPERFFVVFLVFKALIDVGSLVPQWQPRQPPEWLTKAMNRVPAARRRQGSDRPAGDVRGVLGAAAARGGGAPPP